MKKEMHKKKTIGKGLIILCFVLLCNPYIKTFDLLPDFIAYFILAGSLAEISFKAPYFDEVKTALKRLGFLSIARLFCVVLLSVFNSGGSSADDTVTLFVLVLCAFEIFLAVGAVKSFYSAVEYLSERTSAVTLLSPFDIGKGRKRDLKGIRDLTYIFVIVKCAGNLIPEMLLLYRDPLSGGFNPRFLYPYFFLSFLLVIIVTATAWAKNVKRYFKFVSVKTIGIFSAADELATPEKLAAIDAKRTLKNKKSALVIMTVATFLNLEISFSEFRQINLLPSVIFAVLMTYGFFKLSCGTGKYTVQRVASGIFISAAALKAVVSAWFLLTYEYSDFLISKAAKDAYVAVMVTAVIELFALIFYMISLAISMSEYTDLSLRSANLDVADRTELEYKRSFRIKAWVLSALGILTGALKCAQVIINSTINSEFVSTSDTSVSEVFYSDAPWITVIVTLAVIVFGFFAVHYLGAIKDDEELKHGELLHS